MRKRQEAGSDIVAAPRPLEGLLAIGSLTPANRSIPIGVHKSRYCLFRLSPDFARFSFTRNLCPFFLTRAASFIF